MDIERLKQNLRLRSGRTRLTRKEQKAKTPTQVQTVRDDNLQPLRANPPGPLTALPSFDAMAPARTEVETLPPDQPKQYTSEEKKPRVKVQPNEETSKPSKRREADPLRLDRPEEPLRRKSTKYGNSGIEIPMSGYSADPAPAANSPEQSRLSHAQSHDMLNFDLTSPVTPGADDKLSIEKQSELLFSGDHLNCILHTPSLLSRFTTFLYRFMPAQFSILIRYLETQKAVRAIAYANAVIEGLPPVSEEHDTTDSSQDPKVAASLDQKFESFCESAFKNLVENALPVYLTYSLVKNSSDLLATSITGRATPISRELVDGLSEVFCLTDPTREDNPILYASEEFYRLTRYSREDVIGYNCRFLQGPRTKKQSIQRLATAIKNGDEVCETLLNYRRDGRPFVNLLMLAPLHDDKGNVKYFLGAQVDVTGMVEGGRGLDSFHSCLMKQELQFKKSEPIEEENGGASGFGHRQNALARLRDLSELFDLEEHATVQASSRPGSAGSDVRSQQSIDRPKSARRTYADDEVSDIEDDEEKQTPGTASAWRLSQSGPNRPSGKLPGVYETFMLIRPAPSLRIVFASPKLHKVGHIVQSPFMSHVAATEGTLSGLKSSFRDGTPVTAKIYFMSQRGDDRYGTVITPGSRNDQSSYGRACWISCTPLKRVDEVIGVWMVVFVEENKTRLAFKQAQAANTTTQANTSTTRKPEQAQDAQSTNHAKTEPNYDREVEDFDSADNQHDQVSAQDGSAELGNDSSIMHTPLEPSYVRSLPDSRPGEQYHEIGRAYQHVPTAQSPPLPAQNSDIDDNAVTSEDEFVQTRPRQTSPNSNERVIIRPDSEAEPNASNDENLESSSPQHEETPIRAVPTWSPPAETPRSIPSDAQFADDSEDADFESPSDARQAEMDSQLANQENPDNPETSERKPEANPGYVLSVPPDTTHEEGSEIPPSPSPEQHRAQLADGNDRPGSRNSGLGRKNTGSTERPISPTSNYRSNAMRLEYVMLPNSRQSTESYRGMTGSWQVRTKEESDEDRITENECARSPYSVD